MNYLNERDNLEHKNNKKIEYTTKQIDLLKKLLLENNLLIIGSSQKGKTTLLRKILTGYDGKIMLVDSFNEIDIPNVISVKYNHGFYKMDQFNEVTKFAIKAHLNEELDLLVYDDFYGFDTEQVFSFLDSNKNKRLLCTINNKKAEDGLKMILKRMLNTQSIDYTKHDIESIKKYFKYILFIGEAPQLLEIKVENDEVYLERLFFK